MSIVAHGNFGVWVYVDRSFFGFYWSVFTHLQGACHALAKWNLFVFCLGSETSIYKKIQHRVDVQMTVKSGIYWVNRLRASDLSFFHSTKASSYFSTAGSMGIHCGWGDSSVSSRGTSSSCRRLWACRRTIKVRLDTLGFDGMGESDEEDDRVVPIHRELGDGAERSG